MPRAFLLAALVFGGCSASQDPVYVEVPVEVERQLTWEDSLAIAKDAEAKQYRRRYFDSGRVDSLPAQLVLSDLPYDRAHEALAGDPPPRIVRWGDNTCRIYQAYFTLVVDQPDHSKSIRIARRYPEESADVIAAQACVIEPHHAVYATDGTGYADIGVYYIGVFDDVLLLEEGTGVEGSVLGIDIVTGEERFSGGIRPR
jgi:hypothetical protein